ncbi:MAG TPA: hypothetical protein VH393_00150 [Ktedonobacterales bacterium]
MALLRSRRRADVWYTLLFVGLGTACAGLIAAICVLWIYYPAYMFADWRGLVPGFVTFLVASCLAAAFLGPALWWRAIIQPDRLTVPRGAGIGALGGILVHPVVLYVLFVEAYFTGQSIALPIGTPTNPLLDIISAILGAVVSVLFAGWITAPIGALAGAIIAALQSKNGCQERWRAALTG